MNQCKAIKKSGYRCHNDAVVNGLCVIHLYQERKKQEEGKDDRKNIEG